MWRLASLKNNCTLGPADGTSRHGFDYLKDTNMNSEQFRKISILLTAHPHGNGTNGPESICTSFYDGEFLVNTVSCETDLGGAGLAGCFVSSDWHPTLEEAFKEFERQLDFELVVCDTDYSDL